MKFSRIFVPLATLIAATGCAYIIPPEQNTSRNNIVLGEPHRPQLNTNVYGKGQQSMMIPKAAIAPMAQNSMPDMPDLPPVDAATQVQAQQQIAQMDIQPTPVPAAPQPGSDRHVPTENAQFQVSANETTPSLMNVPPRPALSGPGSSKDRLNAVQTDLLDERVRAQAQKDALARDAAAEPSMLSKLPATDAIMAPVNVAPLPPRVTTPVKPQAKGTFDPLNQPEPSTIASAPAFSAPAPLVLQRPVENIAAQDLPAPSSAPAPIAYATRPTVKPGDFDPLAVADNAPLVSANSTTPARTTTTYASEGYLAASRYAGRRY